MLTLASNSEGSHSLPGDFTSDVDEVLAKQGFLFLQFSTGAYYSAIAHTHQPPPFVL
jgi:hypothetical protein